MRPFLVCALGLCSLDFGTTALAQEKPSADYLKEIKPLLQARCFSCHGALKQKGGLRLDTVNGMLEGGDSGAAIAKGDAKGSLLLERVSARKISERMPPEHEGEPLSELHIAKLKSWIQSGATGPAMEQPEADPRDHWAFRPIVRPAVPKVRRTDWVRNPIDAFIAKQHEQHGLSPQPEATRTLLLRRLSLDLIGLPPTVEEMAAVGRDPANDWYERAVRRLLDDPRHGERWARHWMDIWRYSDWWGLGNQLRNSQQHIWHWRDWIVESLNANTPYDEMVRLMLAADELHPNDLGKLRATGYLARNYFLFNRHQWMDETVEHVSKAFLGLTTNCAKCHDHKFDPISQHNYYALRAFFEPYHVRTEFVPGETDTTRDGIPRAFDGLLDAPTYRFIRGQEATPDKSTPIAPGIPGVLKFAELSIRPIDLSPEAYEPERRSGVIEAYLAKASKNRETMEANLVAVRKKQPLSEKHELQLAELRLALAEAELLSVERRASAQRASWIMPDVEASRAASRAEREVAVVKAMLAVAEAELRLHKAAADKRTAVEKDVASARVAVEKAVQAREATSEKYTKFSGASWAATRFLNSGVDDPAVAFPARSTGRRRALAEWITDRRNPLTARVAANHLWTRHFGTPLVPTVFDFGRKGTPPTNPELLDWLASELIDSGWNMKHMHELIVRSATYRLASTTTAAHLAQDPDNQRYWRHTPQRLEAQAVRDSILALAGTLDSTRGGPPVPMANQRDSTRRSLYFFHSNNERNLFLTLFDDALVKDCYRREQSIVPQQALALANSKLVLDASGKIADRLTKDADDTAFVRLAFTILLGVEPAEPELAASLHALAEWKKLPETKASARAQFIWVLLNHNDFVTVR